VQGSPESHDEDHWDHEEFWVKGTDGSDWYNYVNRGVEDQAEAWTDHDVQLADIVGSTGHDVSNALPVMEGETLSKKANIEFVP